MLSRTRGQTATPDHPGQGNRQRGRAPGAPARAESHGARLPGKINGAVGNYNAHLAAYPDFDWAAFSPRFVESLGVAWKRLHDADRAARWHGRAVRRGSRANTILIDLARDLWGYISLGYFRQRASKRAKWSSTMPHKVNPIDFENSEGNLGMANALLRIRGQTAALALAASPLRFHRAARVGVAFGYSLLAWKALRGLAKLDADPGAHGGRLDANWEVLGEAVQTVMRRYGCGPTSN